MTTPVDFARPEPLFPTWTNPLALNNPIEGKVFGQSHWEEVFYSYERDNKKGNSYGIIDKSTLDKAGNGQAYIYASKPCEEHYSIVTMLTFTGAIPIYAAGVIVYNILRIVPVVIYLAGRIFYDLANPSEEQKKAGRFNGIVMHHLKEMGAQIWFSIANVIRTPFYAIGFLFGVLWAWVDPWNGRKIAGSFERSWNHNIMRHEGVWGMKQQDNFHFEGGGDPNKLGYHAYYLPGCYQPMAIAIFNNGNITEIQSISGNSKYALKHYEEVNNQQWHCIPIGCKV